MSVDGRKNLPMNIMALLDEPVIIVHFTMIYFRIPDSLYLGSIMGVESEGGSFYLDLSFSPSHSCS